MAAWRIVSRYLQRGVSCLEQAAGARSTVKQDRCIRATQAPDFEAKVQVKSGHYGLDYEGSARWVNYGAQVRSVLRCSPGSVLEVGIGNSTVCAILRNRGLAVTTLDMDPSLEPDIVGSVHELDRYVDPKSFDLVLCAEVLEHVPFDLLATCCEQLAAAARKNVIIGLPCFPRPRWGFELNLHIPRIGMRKLALGLSPLPRWPGPGREHYWAVDYRPYTSQVVWAAIAQALVINEVVLEPTDPGHVILSCRPRTSSVDSLGSGEKELAHCPESQ